MENDERKLRGKQFLNALALASAAFKKQDYANTKYWLDGAALILSTTENYTVGYRREESHSACID